MILFRLLDWICRTLSLSHLIVFSYFIFPNKFPKCVSEQVHFLLTSDRSPRPFKKHQTSTEKKGRTNRCRMYAKNNILFSDVERCSQTKIPKYKPNIIIPMYTHEQ